MLIFSKNWIVLWGTKWNKISIIDREKYFDIVNFEVTYEKIKGKKDREEY